MAILDSWITTHAPPTLDRAQSNLANGYLFFSKSNAWAEIRFFENRAEVNTPCYGPTDPSVALDRAIFNAEIIRFALKFNNHLDYVRKIAKLPT